MSTCLILGASRGIGRELARQYAADGVRVIATYRQPSDGAQLGAFCARTIELDLLQATSTATLGEQLRGEPIDLAIVVAGIAGPNSSHISAPERADFDAVMHTNVLASMQLIPLLAEPLAATHGKLAVISSKMGSIGSTTNASWWLYRASKAALNSVLKSASVELGSRGIVCMALHPGWVRTDLGGQGADLGVDESVASMRRVIAAANRSHNGRFLNYNGEQLEW
ncbi:Dehydrogenases with different specificities (Short-chain alcohol dehydrogenases-like protein) [Burkholderiales bacterium]|nr:Dehydrogenases with different specificities (Short-chain alcohol dehydrogenases-like protein) [Burkholderiales bacterium]